MSTVFRMPFARTSRPARAKTITLSSGVTITTNVWEVCFCILRAWHQCWLYINREWNGILEKSWDSERCSGSRSNYSNSRERCRRPQKRDLAEISVHPYSYPFLSHDPASPGACRPSCSLSRQRSRIISMNESDRRRSVPGQRPFRHDRKTVE